MASKPKVFITNHQIYLTENQRYDLYACIAVKTTGIMTQAQIQKNLNAKDIIEIFCKYEIDCNNSEEAIEIVNNTIKIHIPAHDSLFNIIDEYELLSDKQEHIMDINDLLNAEEGGKESLFYETVAHDVKNKIKSYHKIQINDFKKFDESVEFVQFN